MPTKQNEVDLELLLGAQQRHVALLMAEGSSYDAKALGIGATNTAILIFIAQSDVTFGSWFGHAVLLALFVLSLVFNALTIIPHGYLGTGVDMEKSPEYLSMDRETVVFQLLSNAETAIKTNDRLNKRRWRYCAASLVLSATGSATLFVIL